MKKGEYIDIFAVVIAVVVFISSYFLFSNLKIGEGGATLRQDIGEFRFNLNTEHKEIDIKEMLFQESLHYKVIQWNQQ